ncbi:hypothetical protein O181_086632 [Austropuccinia psidii MF-1]|uniref:CCHC-type domain-containing protein n=1 Tax=Austropuccinia psidii MF-1 TaxID=1389203 RepID=A0A9Q3G012_9BASI|nr:hypothetical protein [Austropuccinia psidii MF-1]
MDNAFGDSSFDTDKDKPLTWFLKQVDRLNTLYPELSQRILHIKLINKWELELENTLRSQCIPPFSIDNYTNILEDIVTRAQLGRNLQKLDIKSPKKPFITKYKQKEPSKPKSINEERKFYKCGSFGQWDNNCLKKEKIYGSVET